MKIRRAETQDIPALLAVKQATWPDETVRFDYADSVLRDLDHVTLIAEIDGDIAGFLNGFLTLAADGARRWEVDLLAVYFRYRNQGIARRLIAASTEAGLSMGATVARALIKTDNAASQRAFVRAGFRCIQVVHALYISMEAQAYTADLPYGAHLIPVQTLNYRGIWVEGVISALTLAYAQRVRARHSYDLVGTVIPVSQREAITAAVGAGFTLAGHYQWFTKDAAPAPR
ncbi:MAG: GNAT family N-acetyltransferase [Chloroflexi bacterium]|nr:GNAT family N-acetyltransferase [Chloroflexota bacterium]